MSKGFFVGGEWRRGRSVFFFFRLRRLPQQSSADVINKNGLLRCGNLSFCRGIGGVLGAQNGVCWVGPKSLC